MINGALLYKNNTPAGLIISGNVYNDQNALTGGVDNPVLVGKDDIPTGLKAILVNTNTQLILQIVNITSVDDYGTFAFTPIPAAIDYEVRVTNATLTIGTTAPVSSVLPTYWEITGESLDGVTDGIGDGLVGILAIAANKTVNFGIRITPSVTQPIYIKRVAQAATSIQILDDASKIISSASSDQIKSGIESFFTVGSAGTISVQISHTRIGSFLNETILADKTSPTTFWSSIQNWLFANNFYEFTTVNVVGSDQQRIEDYTHNSYIALQNNEIRGTVFHDPNDLTDSLVNDSRSLVVANGFNQLSIPIGLRVAAVSTTTGLVVRSANVTSATGIFRIINLPYDTYDLILTNTLPIIDNPAPTTTLPITNTWQYTGEGINGISDGTPNGIIPNVVLTGSRFDITFGIKATS
jgi:hypothetical protein